MFMLSEVFFVKAISSAEAPRKRATLARVSSNSIEPHAFGSGRLEALAKEKLDGRLHRTRERSLEPGVEVDHPISGREFSPYGLHVVMTRHPTLLLSAPSGLGPWPSGGANFEAAGECRSNDGCALHKFCSPAGIANDTGTVGRCSTYFSYLSYILFRKMIIY